MDALAALVSATQFFVFFHRLIWEQWSMVNGQHLYSAFLTSTLQYCLTCTHLDRQPGVAGVRTSNPPVTSQPALPPEPHAVLSTLRATRPVSQEEQAGVIHPALP